MSYLRNIPLPDNGKMVYDFSPLSEPSNDKCLTFPKRVHASLRTRVSKYNKTTGKKLVVRTIDENIVGVWRLE